MRISNRTKKSQKIKNNDKIYIHSQNLNIITNLFFIILILSQLYLINCDENQKKKELTKTKILLILLVIIIFIIIVFLIIFFICICCKKRRIQRNEYLEGVNYLERGNAEEIELREKISIEGMKALSDYINQKLYIDTYNKKYEIFGNQCPICLELFKENLSPIIMSGCYHIFHKKCLGDLAENIDINKNIFPQFSCPSCRSSLFTGIDKINECVKIYPNFFDDIYKNKKISKIKQIKEKMELLLNHNKNKIVNNLESSLNVNDNNINNETDRNNMKEENKDFSYDKAISDIKKIPKETTINKIEEKKGKNFSDSENKNTNI